MPDLMWLEYAGCSRRMKELILLTDWPPRSPDLNPVEPLWDMKLRSISLLLTLSRSSVTPWSRTGRKDPPEDHHSFHSDHVWLHKLLFQTTEYHFDLFFFCITAALFFSLQRICVQRPPSLKWSTTRKHCYYWKHSLSYCIEPEPQMVTDLIFFKSVSFSAISVHTTTGVFVSLSVWPSMIYVTINVSLLKV